MSKHIVDTATNVTLIKNAINLWIESHGVTLARRSPEPWTPELTEIVNQERQFILEAMARSAIANISAWCPLVSRTAAARTLNAILGDLFDQVLAVAPGNQTKLGLIESIVDVVLGGVGVEPEHSVDCGTRYRGCAPDCEVAARDGRDGA